MATTARCPACGTEGPVPDTFQGKCVRCPKCKTKFVVNGRRSKSIGDLATEALDRQQQESAPGEDGIAVLPTELRRVPSSERLERPVESARLTIPNIVNRMPRLALLGGGAALALVLIIGLVVALLRSHQPGATDATKDEVASYIRIARAYLASGQKDKAVEYLEKAVAVPGAGNKDEAVKLLTETLASRPPDKASTDAKRPVDPSAMSPEDVVRAYLGAREWQDRLPYVLDPERVRPIMAETYRNTPLEPEKYFRPGKILPFEKGPIAVGGKLLIRVDVSDAVQLNKGLTDVLYVVVRTREGYKIDWESSIAEDNKRIEEAERRALQIHDAIVELQVLKVYQDYHSVRFDVHITNKSNRLLSYVNIAVDIADKNGQYLGNDFTNESNIRPGQTVTKTNIRYENVRVDEVFSWKPALKAVSIDAGGGERADATKYYTLKEVAPTSGNGRTRRMEEALLGHWVSGDTHFYFAPGGVVMVGDGERRTFRMETIERDFARSILRARCINVDDSSLGSEWAIQFKEDQASASRAITHLLDDGEWKELKDELIKATTEELRFVNKAQQP